MENQNKKPILHVAFTGHRPNKLAGYNISAEPYKKLQKDLERFIVKVLERYETVVCHSGLALGGDTVWSKAILTMRERFPDRVKFHAEIPMFEQPERWFRQSDIDFWQYQIKNADYRTVYGSLKDFTGAQRDRMASLYMNKRNEGMVNRSNVLLALWNGTPGGTGNTVKYARSINKKIIIINPSKYFN